MNIFTYARKKATQILAALAVLVSALLVSCDSFVYDYEGDCSVTYRIKFRYDKNLKWADAFANEVSSVHLYAFDRSGRLVWQNEERIALGTADNYYMNIDLPAGDYRLVAWCGLRNDGNREESFSVPEVRLGETGLEALQCSLNRKYDDAGAYSGESLYRLFHGAMDVTLPVNDDGGSYEYTMPLTKNTNHIRVILQHLSGKDVDVERFTFRIDDENGLMAHDNGLMSDENIMYRPWKTQNGIAGVGKEDSRAVIQVKGAIADLTVGRMMETHRKKMLLTIIGDDGKTVAVIPVIDYALLAKDFYEQEYGHRMTDQEFLDREDNYVMTFFLDDDNEWISSMVMIHSWVVVPQDVEIR